jgi:hypothetical protein
MAIYSRRRDSDTWHWCTNCSNYPSVTNVETSYSKPRFGELSNECRSKEKSGTWR